MRKRRNSVGIIISIYILALLAFCEGNTFAKNYKNVRSDGWYFYRGSVGGKEDNYIYRKGNNLIVNGHLRSVNNEFEYPGKELGKKKRTFKLSKKVTVFSFPEGKKEKKNWKTLREWGWYNKKHFSPAVYFRVENGEVVYISIHS